MDSTNNNLTIATINSIIQETYVNDITLRFSISSLVLLSYGAFLKFPQEIEYIWFKPFSLPTFLYIAARYAPMILQILYISIDFTSSSGRTCDILANVANCMACLSLIGVQGLLVARGYSICQGGKTFGAALVFGFVSGLILDLYHIIAYPGCQTSGSGANLVALIMSINVVFTDLLVFGICIWNVSGIWKLKKEAGIQSGFGIVSVLFIQSISRCCFVVVITVANGVMSMISTSSFTINFAAEIVASFQNSLSAILVADFTLDLRRLNNARIETSQVSSPALQFSNVLQHAYQSLLIELATPEDRTEGDLEKSDDHGHDNSAESVDDIQPAQE